MKMLSLKVLRESGRKKLFIVPYVFTFGNAFFGFMAVIKTFEFEFITAANCIILAAIMDFFDGRLARAFDSSSYLGTELDSLSDAVSFCFAPAVLLYSWYLHEAGAVGVAILTAYLCAGLLRLAKFNLLAKDLSVPGYFVGLPTTVSAFVIAQLVAHYRWIMATPLRFILHPVGILIFVATLTFLMVSPVRFASFKRLNMQPVFLYLVVLIITFFISISLFYGIPFLFIGLIAYVVSGISFELYSLIHSSFLS